MTEPTLPPMPSDPPPPPAPKKPRITAVIIGSAAAVIAAVVATGLVVVQSEKDDSKPPAAAESSIPDADASAAAAQATDPTYVTIDTDSFSAKLRTTKRQCFGSAGCNVTVEPNLTLLVGTEDVDPDATYEITYEISGDESGPVIETAELTNQTSLNYRPSMLSTSSASTKVSIEITDVQKQ
ncbi:hypothetical protein [Streptomyces sp. NPDC056785]|uniref:hypothetical protein n=1 Tax=Streptomyces sp. NPDC056785 TaxID=3345944 RepID=UPI0036CA9E12